MLRRSMSLVGVFSLALGCGLVVASSSSAAQREVSTSLGTATIEVQDVTFEVTGCLEVPFSVTVSGAVADTSWNFKSKARLEGTAPTMSAFTYGDGSSRDTDTYDICPSDGAGRWIIGGDFTIRNYGLDTEIVVPTEVDFTVSKATTRTIISSAKPASTSVAISGQVTSTSARYGVVGVPGEVVVQVRKGTSKKWTSVGTVYADARGNFSVTSSERYPKGSLLRATHLETDATVGSVSPTRRL